MRGTNKTGGKGGPLVFTRLSPLKPTVAYDTFWRFAVERQAIFFARVKGQTPPWTHDPILSRHKFTNAYRASDRVSQFLIKEVVCSTKGSVADAVFRILLFKLFNKIETWQLLVENLGEISWASYQYETYEKVLSDAFQRGRRIYSAAYIMASGAAMFDVQRKHQGHLLLLERMMKDGLPRKLEKCRSMKDAFEALRGYPLVGDFLAYQLVTDLNYSEVTDFSEMEFTMPGPGARDGIRKCFSDLGGLSEAEVIHLVTDRQQLEFQRLGLTFQDLWGRPLQLIDVQNLFCEVDKYCRVRHPQLSGLSGRTRIKQSFRMNAEPIQYVYPPKWGLNTPTAALQRTSQPALF